MQKLVSKYGLAAHLALLAVAPLVLFSFLPARDVAVAVLWLALSGALWLFLEPSRRSDEMLHDARMRVAKGVATDPLFWLLATVAAYAAVRWANGGVAVGYDASAGSWTVSAPSVGWLPGHAGDAGFLEFAAAAAIAVAVAGCRHALGRSARAAFLFCLSFAAGVAAIAAVAYVRAFPSEAARLMALDVSARHFAGGAFGLCALCGVVAFAAGFECKWTRLLLFFSVAIGGSAAGLFYFAPTPLVALYAGAFAVAAIACAAWLFFTGRPADLLKFAAGLFIASVVPVAVAAILAPEDATAVKTACFADGTIFPAGFAEMRARLSDIAASVWRGKTWLGAGLGGFPLQARFLAVDEDWIAWGSTVPSGTLNGWMQLAAERGIVGAAALALPAAFLLAAWVLRAVFADYRRSFLPLCLLGPLAALAVAAQAFIDISFMDPACLSVAASILALSASAFPQAKKKAGAAAETKKEG